MTLGRILIRHDADRCANLGRPEARLIPGGRFQRRCGVRLHVDHVSSGVTLTGSQTDGLGTLPVALLSASIAIIGGTDQCLCLDLGKSRVEYNTGLMGNGSRAIFRKWLGHWHGRRRWRLRRHGRSWCQSVVTAFARGRGHCPRQSRRPASGWKLRRRRPWYRTPGGGGGAVEIGAVQKVTISGQVDAIGGDALPLEAGGGSGGGIFIHAADASISWARSICGWHRWFWCFWAKQLYRQRRWRRRRDPRRVFVLRPHHDGRYDPQRRAGGMGGTDGQTALMGRMDN